MDDCRVVVRPICKICKMLVKDAYLGAAILPRSVLAFWHSAAPAKKYALVISAMHAIHTFVLSFRQVGVPISVTYTFISGNTACTQVIFLFEWRNFNTLSQHAHVGEKYTTSVSADFSCCFVMKLWIESVEVQICESQSMGVLVSNVSSKSKIWSVLFY